MEYVLGYVLKHVLFLFIEIMICKKFFVFLEGFCNCFEECDNGRGHI
jgi:hypothetical protein